MRWFSPKSRKQEPKQAEPQPVPPPDETITISLKCMKCSERFEVTISTRTVQTAPGFCPCCKQVIDWLTQGDQYFDFLRSETEATRKNWKVKP